MSDYIVKCDVPRKALQDNSNCMDGCVALVEHATNGKKRTKRKKVAL